ncbi:hypothetical protein RB608_10605 [Nocardioides sp. LHD-245]|uniref:hypothetical protein n=1 Tax=Nocardioides sp. LHD-245 TaxID=3051387 RepID=UPI0027E024DE|nr:hypothetical protein [Nocardioides sp. LHD-245]
MVDLNAVNIEGLASALADQTGYDHRWLIDPHSGEILFWTSDCGIDGENSVDIDELDHLVLIDPLPSYVWHQDMVDFAEGSATVGRASASVGRFRARAPSGASGTSSINVTPTWCRRGAPSATAVRERGPCVGWPTRGWSTTTTPSGSAGTTRKPSSPDLDDSQVR